LQHVKIANHLEHHLALQEGKSVDPWACQIANERARRIITAMNNTLLGAGVGHLATEPAACKNFYVEDHQAIKDRNRAEQQALERSTVQRNEQGRNTGARCDEGRATNPRNNNRNNNPGNNNPGNNAAAPGGASDVSD
jgi:hypothetical protein